MARGLGRFRFGMVAQLSESARNWFFFFHIAQLAPYCPLSLGFLSDGHSGCPSCRQHILLFQIRGDGSPWAYLSLFYNRENFSSRSLLQANLPCYIFSQIWSPTDSNHSPHSKKWGFCACLRPITADPLGIKHHAVWSTGSLRKQGSLPMGRWLAMSTTNTLPRRRKESDHNLFKNLWFTESYLIKALITLS